MLAAAHDLALVAHQILLGQAAGCVLRRSVPNLSLRARGHLGAAHHRVVAIVTILAILTRVALATLHRRESRHLGNIITRSIRVHFLYNMRRI